MYMLTSYQSKPVVTEMQVFPDSGHKKCARIVGDTMGKYHPHGDSSIYEALARMAQDFSMSMPLIDGQGNFGSIDGDGPAAMRYTEARMAPIALEMLRDINKDTVPFQLNFDDSLKEPSVLPSRFPNILVNGATGIAVGLATNIPPHNLKEVIDGVILRIQQPDCSLADVMRRIKGPDFPTGGVILGKEGIKQAYETGKGKITLRAKTEIEQVRNGKTRIVITELPYEIRESAMLRKIQQLRTTRKDLFAGISDVRSETDRTGLRAVIELKSGTNAEKVLDCLYKYSDMQISYGINMVAIADGQPKLLGLLEILDYYINFQRDVVTRRVQFDKEAAEEKEHKLEGLIIAVTNIDLVIKIIRSSSSSKEAKAGLMEKLHITGIQAQAILDLRLARLTQLEVITLREEYEKTVALLNELRAILASQDRLDGVIIEELSAISSKYAIKRRTPLSSESGTITIDEEHFKVVEECAVIYTKGGNLKRMSKKVLARGAEGGEATDRNLPAQIIETNTEAKLWLFTNHANLYSLDVENIKEAKYKDAGSTINSLLAGIEKGEKIISVSSPAKGRLLTVSKSGIVKYTDFAELESRKQKIIACGLKPKDELLLAEADIPSLPNLLLITKAGMSICFSKEEISLQGKTGKGVGGIKLAADDSIIFAAQTDGQGNIAIFSELGFAKQSKLSEYEVQGRNGKGLKTFQWAKGGTNGSYLVAAVLLAKPTAFEVVTNSGQVYPLTSAELPLEERYSKGAQLVPAMLGDFVAEVRSL
ncbi:MAG: DNA topoisomerase 4 subunit A [Clostridiales bacterium]|nr:DNA topoisomerase 4 subunit A [Clostridiales bacterium]